MTNKHFPIDKMQVSTELPSSRQIGERIGHLAKACIVVLALASSLPTLQSCRQDIALKQSAEETYSLVWSDEFNGKDGLDQDKWSFQIGDGCPELCGWGNNEKQYYTNGRPENARVENGSLIIEAHREQYQNSQYSSAKLLSKEKGDIFVPVLSIAYIFKR